MTSVHLLDNNTAGWEPLGLSGTGQTDGITWHTSASGFVVGFRWRRLVTPSDHCKPSAIGLFGPDGLLIHSEAVGADPGGSADAWVDVPLSAGLPVTSGSSYYVAAFYPDGSNRCLAATSATGTPPSPLVVDNFRYHNGGSLAFWSDALGYLTGVDVAWDTTDTTGGGGGGGGTGGEPLAPWFSSDATTNTHHSDLPWRTDANVTTLKGEAEGVNGFAAIKAVADAVAAAVSGLPGTIAGAVTTITGQLTSMTGTMFDTGIATIGSISHDMADVMSNALKLFDGLSGGTSGALSGRSAFPTELWTLAAEDDFTECVAITEPADLYVVSVTTVPHGKAITSRCGVDLIYRAGWWSQLNGSFATERHFLDYVDNHLVDGGRRMPGALVALEPEGAGHWQAWRLT